MNMVCKKKDLDNFGAYRNGYTFAAMAGRKKKPESEKFIRRNYKFHPDLVSRLEYLIPESKRSMFVAMAIERTLDILEGVNNNSEEILKEFQH